MRIVFRHISARAAAVVVAVGLISAPATAGSALAATAAPSASCSWKVETLAVPAGFGNINVMEASGQYIVGSGRAPDGTYKPLRWSKLGKSVTVLETPSGQSGHAFAVNKYGVVAGNDNGDDSSFVWIRGRATKLAVPAGTSLTHAGSINDAGTIVGQAVVGDQQHGLVWSARSPRTFQDLGTGDGYLSLSGIDQAGTIVGTTSEDEYGSTRALKGTAAGGLSPVFDDAVIPESSAGAVNGPYVLGNAFFPEISYHRSAFVKDGAYTIMPVNYYLMDVNSSGLVAANDYIDSGETSMQLAAVWQDGTSTRLPLYQEGVGTWAEAVTEAGVVVGTSRVPSDGEDFATNIPVKWTCS